MKLVACAIIGDGRFFTVRIESFLAVGDLMTMIKEKRPSIITCEAGNLSLYLAKKNNAWLKESDPDTQKLAAGEFPPGINGIIVEERNKMNPGDRMSNAAFDFPEFDDEEVEDDVIHVLVALPGLLLQVTQDTAFVAKEPHPIRKKRWEELNVGLDRNATAAGGVVARLDSDTLKYMDRVVRRHSYVQSSKGIDDEKIRVLHAYLGILTRAFVVGGDGKQRHLILPVLACVCNLFDGEARILEKETVIGNRVHGKAHFDFVLEHGSTMVFAAVPERSDFEQGVAQACVGAEALADTKGLTNVSIIVTDFVEWYFLRSLEDKIERNPVITLQLDDGAPTFQSLKYVAERIYAMLLDVS